MVKWQQKRDGLLFKSDRSGEKSCRKVHSTGDVHKKFMCDNLRNGMNIFFIDRFVCEIPAEKPPVKEKKNKQFPHNLHVK